MTTDSPGSGTAPLLERILIATDASSASRHALAYARGLVRPGTSVCLVSVAENPRTVAPIGATAAANLAEVRDELRRDAANALDQAKALFSEFDVRIETDVIDLSTQGGDIARALVQAAHAWQADLAVVGARQHHGIARWVEGSVSEPLAKLSRCPLLIVPEHHDAKLGAPPGRILFALDGSDPALDALRYGLRFATPDAHLRAIYVVDRAVRLTDFVPIDALEHAFVDEGERALATAGPILAKASAHADTSLVYTERTSDDIAHAIVREARNWDADLIVMGSHGRRGITRWLVGSVAGRVAQLAQTPLLLVNANAVPPDSSDSPDSPH